VAAGGDGREEGVSDPQDAKRIKQEQERLDEVEEEIEEARQDAEKAFPREKESFAQTEGTPTEHPDGKANTSH
jgi:hypothetical protein